MTEKIILRVKGKEYQVESVAALDALLDHLEKREGISFVKKAPHPRTVTLLTTSIETQLLHVLERIRLNRKGLEANEVCKLAELQGPRGLGSATRGWRRVLAGMGLELDEVLVKARDLDSRLWLPGPKLEEAVRELRERVKK